MAIMPRFETFHGQEPDEVPFSVQQLLELPLLKDARLVAGKAGAGRAITRVNVMEVPDVAQWVRPGEFLMTTGYPFREEPQRLLQLLPELAKRGVAALGVKAQRSFEAVPPEAAEEAEKLGFALVELPPDTIFSDVVKSVMERVLAQETSQLAVLQSRIQGMTRLLLDGSGLYAFLDAMEEMLDNPVAVVREQDKPWLSLSLREGEPAETWPLLQALTFRQLGRGVSDGFMLLQNARRVYVSPIPTRKMKQACLVLLERSRDITPLDALSVDRLSSLAGLEMANVEAVREVEGKYLEQFMQDWLSGKIVSEMDWKLRADVCGCTIPEDKPMCAAMVVWGQNGPSADKLREFARRLRTDKLTALDGLLAAPVGGDLALVLSVETDREEIEASEQRLAKLLGKLHGELCAILGDGELKLYAGKIAGSPAALPGSWAQAKRARQVAEVCGLRSDVVPYDRLGVYALLYLIPSGEERGQFLKRYAIPLQQADRKGGGRLVETLDMFFRCNGNIKLTSEKLYAHYNTIVYRLEKIQSILGVSLDDPDDRLQLHLALKLGQITPGPPG